ncbi:MAG: hypothetical protein FWG18_01615 [Alphaproteobacteria bacterium]|nr:hypothetical protein [Alphaproteobacteria bacterium]
MQSDLRTVFANPMLNHDYPAIRANAVCGIRAKTRAFSVQKYELQPPLYKSFDQLDIEDDLFDFVKIIIAINQYNDVSFAGVKDINALNKDVRFGDNRICPNAVAVLMLDMEKDFPQIGPYIDDPANSAYAVCKTMVSKFLGEMRQLIQK